MTNQPIKPTDTYLDDIAAALAEITNCIACNGFSRGSGWCDRHRQILQTPDPILESVPTKESDAGAYTYKPKTRLP